jgi:Mn2+/Fe2+ NRAMP family transporter
MPVSTAPCINEMPSSNLKPSAAPINSARSVAILGIATGKNLAEHIRDRFPRPAVWFYWVQAEIIATL